MRFEERSALKLKHSKEIRPNRQITANDGPWIKNIQYMTVARIIYPDQATEWSQMAKKSAYRAAMLAKELHVSQRQLRRYTRNIFGRSPQNWLNEQRLVHAAEMLKRTRTAKAVAFQLGFKQPSHFSREFKRHYGVSPTRFLVWSDGHADLDSLGYRQGKTTPDNICPI